ncbi:SapC family protein [uncultured Paraglaciecola sp.]|jgi:hypothetical protein|uniref:SapC family protein n=1 Tax=uncultured Paraglaciecola sp. TaxID=1765024 RepID=UPI00233AB100|nr:SapC family protein [uncultured Paraglaciecola sp.]MDB4326937.1 SapC family protein [bacterium]
MSELVELSSTQHQGLKVRVNCGVEVAATQQIVKLRVNEVGRAAGNFPIFFTRSAQDGALVLSALTSFESQQNMFVKDGQWQSTYQPSAIKTFPFFLMRSKSDAKSYTIGIDEKNQVFSKEHGELLFEENGKASMQLSRAKVLLEADIQNDIHTFQFGKELEQMGLLKSIDLVVQYQDGTNQSITGLITIDEDKINALSAEQLHGLNQQGYLVQIHALLISIYQLNSIIQKQNSHIDLPKVAQLKIEVAKDRAAG